MAEQRYTKQEIIEFMRQTGPINSPKLSVFANKALKIIKQLQTEVKRLGEYEWMYINSDMRMEANG